MTKGVRTDADLGGKAWLASQGDAQGIHVLLLYDNGLSTKYDTVVIRGGDATRRRRHPAR